jgi:DNA-binding MarR family transcriptional regulator
MPEANRPRREKPLKIASRARKARPSASEGDGVAQTLSKPARLALDRFRLENVGSHLLRRAHFAAEEAFAREFEVEAITPRQKAALVAVYQKPGINQNELSTLLFMDRNTVAEMVQRLSARALVKRMPAANDRRAYRLFLAPKGAALLDRVILRDAKVEKKIFARLSKADRTTLIRCLRILAQPR